MKEFVLRHLAIVREKGPVWQINVVWKTIAIIGALVFAAHLVAQKSLDRRGLAHLAAKEAAPAKDRVRSR
ncbi:MAG TPA: hypothetical protein VH743_18705 [Beijerinckiaceae bacterium]|jgi:hypothetical protein